MLQQNLIFIGVALFIILISPVERSKKVLSSKQSSHPIVLRICRLIVDISNALDKLRVNIGNILIVERLLNAVGGAFALVYKMKYWIFIVLMTLKPNDGSVEWEHSLDQECGTDNDIQFTCDPNIVTEHDTLLTSGYDLENPSSDR